jgi:hypothetical protein
MLPQVGTVVVEGFPPKKEADAEKLRGQYSSSVVDPNFSFEQGKHVDSILPIESFIFYACKYIVHLHIGFE